MSSNLNGIEFHSSIAEIIKQFIYEKRACGYKYNEALEILKHFDSYLYNAQLKKPALPKDLVLQWAQKKSSESVSSNQRRISFIRELARFMIRMDCRAYIVPGCFGTTKPYTFSPYIFTKKEIKKLIQAADTTKPSAHSPLRHLIIPEIFRLLYCCGFRIGEVLNLRISDVDFKQGVITVRGAKFNKDRLVPPALDMVERLEIYAKRIEKESLEKRNNDSFFFTLQNGKALRHSTIHSFFRKLLFQCGIHYVGKRKGPRVHDLRHTFAVHRMIQWHEEGVDLNTKLPLLVAYLGHQDFTGTQKYLHLTAELFPNLTARMNKQFGGVIPKWRKS